MNNTSSSTATSALGLALPTAHSAKATSSWLKELAAHLQTAAHELDTFAVKALPFLGTAATVAETLTGNVALVPVTQVATAIAENLAAGAAADPVKAATTAAVGTENLTGNSDLTNLTGNIGVVAEDLAQAGQAIQGGQAGS